MRLRRSVGDEQYGRYVQAIAEESAPLAFVDLNAFDRNLDRVTSLANQHHLPIRLATKSIRSLPLLLRCISRAKAHLQGVMCYHVAEALFLAKRGIEDLFLAYPIAHPKHAELFAEVLCHTPSASLAVDNEAQLAMLAHTANRHGQVFRVVICVDMSLRLPQLHFGVRRSPIYQIDQVVSLAEAIGRYRSLQLEGLMGYEAQIAGLSDKQESFLQSWMIHKLKMLSMRDVTTRRVAMVNELKKHGFTLRFVNGGGTGSLHFSTRDTGVTEVAVGSALFKPHSFDAFSTPHMKELEPSAFFALDVTRVPADDMVTCFGGGFIASGSSGESKLPRPVYPDGLSLLEHEGAGEVQTPLRCRNQRRLKLGDRVIFRHAKAGELCEHFNRLALVQDETIIDWATTYRGDQLAFS